MPAKASSRPPVKQCSTAGKAPFPISSCKNARHVVVGLARMDDQRQAGLARRRDVGAEALLLRVARAVVVVIVEPGLADRHHLRMPRARDQIGRRRCRVPRGRCADACRPSRRRRESARRSPARSACRRTRVEIVTMRPTPAAARARHHGVELVARNRENRDGSGCRPAWCVLSIAALAAARFRLDVAREHRRGRGQRACPPRCGVRAPSLSNCRSSARNASRSSSLPADAGTNGCARIATCRITSAVT